MSDKVYARLKERLAINMLTLDDELINMPTMIIQIGENLATCLSERDAAKNELDIALAEAADDLRRIPVSTAKDGTPKLRSEAQITSELPLNQAVKQATIKLEDAKYQLALWQSLMDAARTKSSSLHKVVDLTISGYITPEASGTQAREKLHAKRMARA